MLGGEVVPVSRASPHAATLLGTAGGFFCPRAECAEPPAEAEGGIWDRGGGWGAAGPGTRGETGERTLQN